MAANLSEFNKGLGLFQTGQIKEATDALLEILNADPNHEETLNLLGIIFYHQKKFEQSIQYLKRAIEENNLSPLTHNNISLAYQELGKYEIALTHSKKSIELNSGIAAFHNTLGNALKGINSLQPALEAYSIAITLNPSYANAFNNKGVVFSDLGQHDHAIDCYQEAIQINPNFAEAFNNLGNSLAAKNLIKKALESYEKAISINSAYTEAYVNLSNTLKKIQELDSALNYLNQAIEINPNFADIYYLKGNLLYEIGKNIEASKAFELALSINPKHDLARFAYIISAIPKVPTGSDEIQSSRALLETRINDAKHWYSTPNNIDFINFGEHQPFYLAYQEQNNRDLLQNIGAITHKLALSWSSKNNVSQQKTSTKFGKIKIGIVSAHLYSHPVWHAITKGWVENLNKDKFEIHFFSLGEIIDAETNIALFHATSFQNGNKDIKEWCQLIQNADIEVIIYPEIGMHSKTKVLSSLYLAPLQIVSWGHPETTGIPSITHFISANAFENEGSKGHYTEELIKLSGLGSCVLPSDIKSSIDIKHLGLNHEQPILICPGSPSKYLPQYDWILPKLAKQIGQCQFVFFIFQNHLSTLLRKRLEESFLRQNLDPSKYISFIPFLEKQTFYSLLKKADVYLDSIGFSGFNTALSAIECNLPVVTREGKFLRDRLGSGILRTMNLKELIAQDEDAFIKTTVRIIKDKDFRESVKKQIQTKKVILFNDASPIRDLENFLYMKCRGAQNQKASS